MNELNPEQHISAQFRNCVGSEIAVPGSATTKTMKDIISNQVHASEMR